MYAYKQLVIAAICMAAVIVVGTIGFMVLEPLNFFDSLWMTMITVLTVGYGDAIPQTTAGKAFALTIIPLGIGIVTYAIGAATALIIEGEIFHMFGRRRMEKKITALEKHVIICGYGRGGAQITEELQSKGIPFIVIDKKMEFGSELVYIEGDATEDEVLHKAGITKAAGLVAALPNDAENVFITLTARGLNHDVQIVARAERIESEEKLRRAGANKVINPSSIAGRRMAMDIMKPLSVNYVDTILTTGEMFGIEEVRIGVNSPLARNTLRANAMRGRFDVTVLAILRGESVIHNPADDEILQEHDMIIVFGPSERLKSLEAACQNKR
ncbi:potassium channel family protein [Ectobacillus antri]|uniref:potassium channel family protein n=1 Tax=Ectobacillus antri TaxID=2486280 RepID=UPI000F5B263A|nr:potassium channel protein [Ectobacillus antri]